MKRVGLVVWFTGAEVRAHPLLDDAGDALELAEQLEKFARAILTNVDLAHCVAGFHDPSHRPGSCVRQ